MRFLYLETAEHSGIHHGRRILPEEKTRGIKLVVASLKNLRAASTDEKDERDVDISVARENSAQFVRSKFQREEPWMNLG